MTIIDSMHAANAEITHPDARELYYTTQSEIDSHNEESWECGRTHAAVMVRDGWDVDTACQSAADKFNLPFRPLVVLMHSEMETFGQEIPQ